MSEKNLNLEGQSHAVLLYVLMQWLEKEKEEENVFYQEILELYHRTTRL
jgi:hypothetical protein